MVYGVSRLGNWCCTHAGAFKVFFFFLYRSLFTFEPTAHCCLYITAKVVIVKAEKNIVRTAALKNKVTTHNVVCFGGRKKCLARLFSGLCYFSLFAFAVSHLFLAGVHFVL